MVRRLHFEKNPYTIMTLNGVDGITVDELTQSASFYAKHRDATIHYLSAVYPTAVDSFKALDDLQLASFYNSLWFYYHCQGKYTDSDLGSFTGKGDDTTWDALPCAKDYPLPYTPQGWLYNFYTYQKFNVPKVKSDSDASKVWLQIENAGSTRPGIMGSYISRTVRPSGIMWWPPRTIHRDVWYPNGLLNDKPLSESTPDNWSIIVDEEVKFNYPYGWYGNLADDQYIEVTHSPSNTGDALNQSPWWWYNGSPGSGMFLYLGKTLAVKNKITGVFELSKLLAERSSGRELLRRWFNTTDPYEITWGVVGLCGYNSDTNQKYCDFSNMACGLYCEPVKIGYANAAAIKLQNFYDSTKRFGVDSSNRPTQNAIKKAIDLAITNEDYYLAHTAVNLLPDEVCFFLGLNAGLDTIQFYADPSPNDEYVFEIIDYRIPERMKEKAKNRDYSDFIHISDPNAPPWSISAKFNRYKQEVIEEYLKNAYENEWLSVRDPIDVYNPNKVLKCDGIKLDSTCNGDYARMQYCANIPLMNSFKCLYMGNEFNDNSCILHGKNPTC